MFGFFRKKSEAPPPAQEPEPEPEALVEETTTTAAATNPGLTAEQRKLINDELARQAKNEGNKLDASIGLLHLTGDKIYLQGLLQFLEDCEIGLLLKEPAGGADFLILTHEGARFLPIFSRPEHAKVISEKFPAYPHVGLVDAKTLFTKLDPGMGLWINPGHSVFTFMVPPAMFKAYMEMLRKKAASP